MTDQQLTRAVAEEVMGWEYAEIADGYYKSYGGYISTASFQDIYIIPDAESPNGKVLLSVNSWKPLTDPRHWMMVVEMMRELGWRMGLNNYDGPYEVEFIPLEVIPSSVASRIGAVNAVNEKIGRIALSHSKKTT